MGISMPVRIHLASNLALPPIRPARHAPFRLFQLVALAGPVQAAENMDDLVEVRAVGRGKLEVEIAV